LIRNNFVESEQTIPSVLSKNWTRTWKKCGCIFYNYWCSFYFKRSCWRLQKLRD